MFRSLGRTSSRRLVESRRNTVDVDRRLGRGMSSTTGTGRARTTVAPVHRDRCTGTSQPVGRGRANSHPVVEVIVRTTKKKHFER